MTARNDERRPGRGGESSSKNTDSGKSTARPAIPWNVVPRVVYVVAGSGRGRYLLVYNCGECRQRHVAHARVLKPMMRRQTACRLGVVVLHAAVEQEVAA